MLHEFALLGQSETAQPLSGMRQACFAATSIRRTHSHSGQRSLAQVQNMTDITPKHPRQRDAGFLRWLREQPCCTCGADKSEAAHIRAGSIAYDKRETGGGEKPDDKWALPQCRSCHSTQHNMNELDYWRFKGMNPFALARRYYARAIVE